MKTGPIACVGAAHLDVVARAGQTVERGDDLPGEIERRPGGVALNVALGLASMGRDSLLVSVLGDDHDANALLAQASQMGIDCDSVLRVSGKTGLYVAIEDASGELVAAIAETNLLEQHSEQVVEAAKTTLHRVSGILIDANLPIDAIRALTVSAAAADVSVTLNPVNPTKALNLAPILALTHPIQVVANLAEANAILDQQHRDAPSAGLALLKRGATTALVTDGPRGCVLATADGLTTKAPPQADEGSVTGAGDALLAAFLAGSGRQLGQAALLDFCLQAAFRHMTRTP